ncbi:UDP-3-O-(3-hydroxymyristoyl)glucosamine N-acyltransferase [Winogradskyella haliclonae]|uniref:UDP-3-O-acylglucosamine N-acyltransferase n=1 Tax=Winogradskyella haliclonae TaxID=2048558 RepID=A0ABQ2BUX7_9FLAO|nr:UDP-3-O-(3-hydroxymyristoyl)glucosamine N-acyltransferase [Winogradskyella haliclonae]GGI56291.1 UDP-3-O-acylglucosamine N-acyltransferase [Winogradskyella haliclonae]
MVEINKILEKINYHSFTGNRKLTIKSVIPINEINNVSDALSWCGDKNSHLLNDINTDSLVIVSNKNDNVSKLKNYLVVENPRRAFQEVLTMFFSRERTPSVSKSAFLADNVKVGKNVFIGHNVVIEENCIIGDNTTILHNTTILSDTIIGSGVTIGSNNTIGGIGFGYEKNASGDFELIPHIGNVIIKNNVDIGNNTCIDRAVLGSTVLEENVKIDNLVHIAHGVVVGRNSVVIANAMVAGSVKIGEDSWIAPSSSILNKKEIGSNALVGMGAVVTKSVEDNTIVAGNPSRFIRSIGK